VDVSRKYARIERERRFLIASLPQGVASVSSIVDRYVVGTRLRLRQVTTDDGSVQRKLGQKIRTSDGATEIAHTTMYLDDAEWVLLSTLPSRVLSKTRHHIERDGISLAVDELTDGTLIAEIDDGDGPAQPVPHWLDVIRDVTAEDSWTGVRLAGE